MRPVRVTDYKTEEIPTGENIFTEVELEASLVLENNDIGPYEFWGQKGYDRGIDYFALEEVTWEKSHFDEPTNIAIEKWIDDNWEMLEKEFEDGEAVKGYFDSLYDREDI